MKNVPLKTVNVFWMLFAAVAIVYGAALICGFVYDDGYLLVRNPYIRDLRNIPDFFAMDVTEMTPYHAASGYYRPFSMTVLTVLFSLFKLTPLLWHAFSLLLHLFSALLIYLIARRWTAPMAAFAGALVFAIHPVHVEAVVPVYNYMGLMAAFFSLLSFWFWTEPAEKGMLQRRFAAVLFYALAVFSKEDTLVLPALFFLHDLFLVEKVSRPRFVAWLRDMLPFGLIGALYIVMRILFVERGAALGLWDIANKFNLTQPQNFPEKILLVVQVYAEYIRMLFWPGILTAFHALEKNIWLSHAMMIYSAILAGVAFFVFLFRRERFLVFAAGWFVVTSFLVSNVIPIGGLFAERLMYLPSVAYAFFLAWIIAKIFESAPKQILWAGLIFTALICGYAARTFAYVPVWKSDLSLWEYAVRYAPNRPLPHLNLAEAYFDAQNYSAAAREFQRTLSFPQNPWKAAQQRHKLARCYGELHDYNSAIAELKHVLRDHPDFDEVTFDLGWTYLLQKKFAQAIETYTAGIKRNPSNSWFYFGAAEAEWGRGNKTAAVENYQKAFQFSTDPGFRQMILGKLSAPKAKA